MVHVKKSFDVIRYRFVRSDNPALSKMIVVTFVVLQFFPSLQTTESNGFSQKNTFVKSNFSEKSINFY